MWGNPVFREALEDSPVITAVKDEAGLERCFSADSRIVFILYGDVLTIADIVDRVKAHGKLAMVHIDLIGGLSPKEIGVDFIKKYTAADGIITTRQALVKRARELALYTVLRFFVIDSMAYANISGQCRAAKPDCMEILPGIMPGIIAGLVQSERIPVIAGGLVKEKEDIVGALNAGAVAVSTTNQDVWFM